MTVADVPPCSDIHRQYRISWFKAGEINSLVCITARVGLNVCRVATEKLAGASDCDALDLVGEFGTTVIPVLRISFDRFIGHHRALSLEYRSTDQVFGRDQFDLIALAIEFALQSLVYIGSAVWIGSWKLLVNWCIDDCP